MSTKQREESNTPTGADETHKESYRLVKRERIEKTLFDAVEFETDESRKCFIAVGQQKVTDDHKTIEEAHDQLAKEPWRAVLAIVDVVYSMREAEKDSQIRKIMEERMREHEEGNSVVREAVDKYARENGGKSEEIGGIRVTRMEKKKEKEEEEEEW